MIAGNPNIDTASYDGQSFDYKGQAPYSWGMTFSDDGTKLYVNNEDGTIFQYTLSTPRVVSTASYASKSLDYSDQTLDIDSTSIRDNGTKLYLLSYDDFTIYQYTLATPRDISTAAYDDKSYEIDEIT